MKIIGNTLMEVSDEEQEKSEPAEKGEKEEQEKNPASASQENADHAEETLPRPKEHKVAAFFAAVFSLLIMVLLTGVLCWEMTGAVLRKTFSQDSVSARVRTISFSGMDVNGWLTQDSETLADYLSSHLGSCGISTQDAADVLDSEDFLDYAEEKINAYVHYVYSRKEDPSVTTEELAVLFAQEVTGVDQEQLRAAFGELNPGQMRASLLEEEYPGTIAVLHYLTSVILMVLIGAAAVLLVIFLILLNRHGLHRVLLYLGLPLMVEGVAGVLVRLFSYPLERAIHSAYGTPMAMVNSFFEYFSELFLSASLVVLIVGAVFLLLFLVIRAILALIRRRAEKKSEV